LLLIVLVAALIAAVDPENEAPAVRDRYARGDT
jgi:hypothetical protein